MIIYLLKLQGFDMQDYSKFNDPGILVRYHYPPHDPASETCVAELEDCSCLAIDTFNREHVWDSVYVWTFYDYISWFFYFFLGIVSQGTHYGNVHVVKANSQALSPCRYYITFQATDRNNNEETFQARVNICFPKLEKVPKLEEAPEFEKEVELVRIKTGPKPIVITRPHKASHR